MLMFSGAWAETSFPRLALHWPPIIVQLWSSALPVRVKQYPISREAEVATRNHISLHRDAGILELEHSTVPCHSIWSGVRRRIWESRNLNCLKQLHLTLPIGSRKNCTHCPVPERCLFLSTPELCEPTYIFVWMDRPHIRGHWPTDLDLSVIDA